MRQNFPFAALAGHNKKRFGIFSNRFLIFTVYKESRVLDENYVETACRLRLHVLKFNYLRFLRQTKKLME